MPTIFFRRLVIACSVLMVVFCCGFAWLPRKIAELHTKTVYFVVYPTESVLASTNEISLRGGAGYALADETVAFSVYFSYDDALDVQEKLCANYPTAQVKSCRFALDDRALTNTLYGILQVIDGWINALDDGARQSVVKNGLAEVAGLLHHVGVESGKTIFFDFFQQVLDVSEDIVYASELRYLLCATIDCVTVSI